MHMPCVADKGSVASVTRSRRPRAGSSHGMSLMNALSSFPLSEPSLKELHTSRAPLGLNKDMPTGCEAVWSYAHEVVPLRSSQKVLTKWYHPTWCSNANWFETHEHVSIQTERTNWQFIMRNNLATQSSACWCKLAKHKHELCKFTDWKDMTRTTNKIG